MTIRLRLPPKRRDAVTDSDDLCFASFRTFGRSIHGFPLFNLPLLQPTLGFHDVEVYVYFVSYGSAMSNVPNLRFRVTFSTSSINNVLSSFLILKSTWVLILFLYTEFKFHPKEKEMEVAHCCYKCCKLWCTVAHFQVVVGRRPWLTCRCRCRLRQPGFLWSSYLDGELLPYVCCGESHHIQYSRKKNQRQPIAVIFFTIATLS